MGAPSWLNIDETENILKIDNVLSMKPDSILSQYAASPVINSLIDTFQQGMDATGDIDLFYNKQFNLASAEGVSLDVWGRIVGITRNLKTDSGQITWDDEYYRFLLMYKALANISSSDAATLNANLTSLFGDNVFLIDNQNMSIRVVFLFYITAAQSAMLTYYGLLTRSGGVLWNFLQVAEDETFGFQGSGLQPFNQGIFIPYGIQEV